MSKHTCKVGDVKEMREGYNGGRQDRQDRGGGYYGSNRHGGGYGGRSGSGGNGGGDYEKPVKEGEEYDVTVESVGEKGDGVCKVNGFVIFVPGVQQGENVRVKVNKVLKRFSIGEVVGRSESSGSQAQAESSDSEGSSEQEVADQE